MRHIAALLVSASLLAFASAANATFYTDAATFNAAAGSLIVENYGSYAPGTLIADGTTLGGIKYSFSTGANLGGVVTNLYHSFTGNSLAAKQLAGPLSSSDFFFGGESFTVTLPRAVTEIGIWTNNNLTPDFTGSLSIPSLGQSFSNIYTAYDPSLPGGTFDFIGFISATPFDTVTFSSLGPINSFNVPEIEFSVPEPASWTLLGFGLACLAFFRIRRTA